MTELPQNSRLTAEEGMQLTAFSAQGNDASSAPPPTKLDHEASELHSKIKRLVAHRTRHPDDDCALVAFWAISTWFQTVLQVFPGLAVSGSAHEAINLLNVLHELCDEPVLLAGLRRGDLKDLGGFTLLISELNLDNRMAALLENLAHRKFLLVEKRSFLPAAGSKAVYIGEDSAIKKIQNSIHINSLPALDYDAVPDRLARQEIDAVRKRILRCRTKNLDKVRSLEFNPRGLSREANVIANAQGSRIVEAPQLQTQLVAWLKPPAQQQIADRSESDEALVVAAAFALCHQDKSAVLAKEIAFEFNRVLEASGKTRRLSPEKVGHKLKKVGVCTWTVSSAGKGLILDQGPRYISTKSPRSTLGRIRYRRMKTSIALYTQRMNYLGRLCRM